MDHFGTASVCFPDPPLNVVAVGNEFIDTRSCGIVPQPQVIAERRQQGTFIGREADEMEALKLKGHADSTLLAEKSKAPDSVVYLCLDDRPIWLRRRDAERLRDWLNELLGPPPSGHHHAAAIVESPR